jgi:hypothetical protein
MNMRNHLPLKTLKKHLKQLSLWTAAAFPVGAAGLVLGFTVSPWFLAAAAGALFLPMLLRAVGALKDLDEFQGESGGKAAVISYIVTGITLFYMIITGRTGLLEWDANAVLMNLLVISLMSYWLAYFFQFWDGLSAGRIISGIILLFWLLFIVLSAFGEDHGLTAFLLETLVIVVPVAAALAASGRYPLPSAILMLAAALLHFIHFDGYEQPTVAFLLPVPELLIGLGYLKAWRAGKHTSDVG